MVEKIVNQLTAIRISKGITAVELSAKTGVSQKHISNIENHKAIPSIETLKKLADGLSVNLELIIQETA